jgi:hypothetical protein
MIPLALRNSSPREGDKATSHQKKIFSYKKITAQIPAGLSNPG